MKKILKKIISTSILTLLLSLNFSGSTQAVYSQAEFLACVEQCVSTTERAAEGNRILTCQNQCRTSLNGPEYLPPIVKPSLVPGPEFDNPEKRTGQEVNQYITNQLFPKIASRFLTFVATMAMIGIVISGLLFYAANGDQDQAKTAKNAAIYSVIGLIIALLSVAIVQVITSLPLNTL
jgi:RNA recognition motif-containing protein